MTAKVPTSDMGSARLGITVAGRFRRNRKMTITTRVTVSISVNFTSATDSRTKVDRSNSRSTFTDGGSCDSSWETSPRTASATATVLVPGCRCTASTTPRMLLNQAATRLSCTPSTTLPRSSRRTGAPFR